MTATPKPDTPSPRPAGGRSRLRTARIVPACDGRSNQNPRRKPPGERSGREARPAQDPPPVPRVGLALAADRRLVLHPPRHQEAGAPVRRGRRPHPRQGQQGAGPAGPRPGQARRAGRTRRRRRLAAGEWLVAQVCSEYIQYCDRGVASRHHQRRPPDRHASPSSTTCASSAGPCRSPQLKKTHIRTWVESHTGWKSPATERSVLAIVIAAFNYCQDNHDVPSPLKGLKKPTAKPRLHSLSTEDEEALLAAADPPFRDFLFAAIHTGLRPFCELARLTAEDVEESPRGMMWRVYASKTDKTRKIPVRPEVAELTRRLLETAPKGSGQPLFRTVTGKAWSEGERGAAGSRSCGRSWGGTRTRCGRGTRATRAGTRSPTGCCAGTGTGGRGARWRRWRS